MATHLINIPEFAPQVRKTEAAARYYLAQPGCPIKVVRLGSRIFVRQEDVDALINGELQEAS